MHIYCSLISPQNHARDGPELGGTCAHWEHLAPGGRWAPSALIMRPLSRIIANWNHWCYWAWLRLVALRAEMNSSAENAPQEWITYGHFPLFFRHSKEEGGIGGQTAWTQPTWRKDTGNPIWKYLKDKWTYKAITGASNNFIHLLVLATLHCAEKTAIFWICKIYTYFSTR